MKSEPSVTLIQERTQGRKTKSYKKTDRIEEDRQIKTYSSDGFEKG